jgi:hypothetical protein
MLLQGLTTPDSETNNKELLLKKSPKKRAKRKPKKVADLTLDQQLECFAQIVVEQFLTEILNYEK